MAPQVAVSEVLSPLKLLSTVAPQVVVSNVLLWPLAPQVAVSDVPL